MGNLHRVVEAEALFMDALGGEFRPTYDPAGNVHTLARLARNMLNEQVGQPIEWQGQSTEEHEKELAWAPATAYLSSVPFELGGFGRWGENREGLLVPVRLSFGIRRQDWGLRSLTIELFHPELFNLDLQPHGPEHGIGDNDGFIQVTAHAYGPRGGREAEIIGDKIELCEVAHGHKAREVVTELAKRAFCEL